MQNLPAARTDHPAASRCRAALVGAVLSMTPLLAQGTIESFEFDVTSLGGRKLSHTTYRENVLIVDFWGTWCGPCREAVPHLAALYQKYKHHGLEIVGLNYREGEGDEAVAKVRKFAADNGITYDLAMGTDAIKAQVPEFGGFPTMLFFKRGLEHDKTVTGFDPSHAGDLEEWVVQALGLEPPTPEEVAAEEAEKERKLDEKEDVADGAIFKPGLHDTGFAHTFEDAKGEETTFAELRGDGPILLVISSTWSDDAVQVAKAVEELRAAHAGDEASPSMTVVGAFYERSRDAEERRTKVQEFAAANSLEFPIVIANLKLIRKVHKLQALPSFLLFDREGKLVHRREGFSPVAIESVSKAIGDL